MTDTRTDPLAHIKEGDVSPRLASEKNDCPETREGYLCTRPRGHVGQHIAGTGFEVAAVWTDEA